MDENLVDIPVGELFQENGTSVGVPAAESVPSGNELIDATQSAIIDAAENVTQVFDTTQIIQPQNIPHEPFYLEIEFWVGMAFILTVIVLAKPAVKFIGQALRGRANRVINDIDEAIKLRDDAQILLADYERRTSNLETETADIVAMARKNLQNLKKYETAQMKKQLQTKEKELIRYMAAETQKARDEINLSASKRSIELAKRVIEDYLQKTDKGHLVDAAIDELDKFIA